MSIGTKLFIVVGLAVAIGGCDNGDGPKASKEPPGVAVTLSPGTHVKPDGMISPAGLDALRAHSGDPIVNVNFLRTNLTDAGLAQLGEFKNVRQVNAIGSRVTDKGIEQLKKAIPEVQVNK